MFFELLREINFERRTIWKCSKRVSAKSILCSSTARDNKTFAISIATPWYALGQAPFWSASKQRRRFTMEDISGFPDGIAFALDGWPQLNEATSLAQLDSSNSSPDTFIQDTMDRETGLFPIQSLQAPMRSEKIIQIPERSSQPIEGSGISFAEGYNIDLASDGTSFPSQSPSQGTQRIVVEQGQNHCQICRKTFKYGSTAVRSVSRVPCHVQIQTYQLSTSLIYTFRRRRGIST